MSRDFTDLRDKWDSITSRTQMHPLALPQLMHSQQLPLRTTMEPQTWPMITPWLCERHARPPTAAARLRSSPPDTSSLRQTPLCPQSHRVSHLLYLGGPHTSH